MGEEDLLQILHICQMQMSVNQKEVMKKRYMILSLNEEDSTESSPG